MSNWHKWLAVALLAGIIGCTAFAAGFGIGHYVFPSSRIAVARVQQEQQEQFQVFWEAWRIVEDEFYTEKPLDNEAMTHGAIRGMVASLGDQHTVFLLPTQADLFREDLEGQFGGIGVTVGLTEDGLLRITKPIAGSPADEAGLRAGDLILEVDGSSVRGMDLIQAIALIRGPKDTEVRLLIQKSLDGQTTEVVLRRAAIDVPTTESRMLDDRVAYLALWECNARAPREVRDQLTQLLDQKPRALVLDLRGNPGGYLYVATEVASEFISSGLILYERGRDGQEIRHEARAGGVATSIPLAVLVDKGSASAAEIIAGAIQDSGRGILVGEQTFGKGSVQTTERLSDGSALQITIRRWYTPKGRQIQEQGLTPDIAVEAAEQDLQLERAVSYLLSITSR